MSTGSDFSKNETDMVPGLYCDIVQERDYQGEPFMALWKYGTDSLIIFKNISTEKVGSRELFNWKKPKNTLWTFIYNDIQNQSAHL